MSKDNEATGLELVELFSLEKEDELEDSIPTCSGVWVRRGYDLWIFEEHEE